MKYQFSNAEVKEGDKCLLIWYASMFADKTETPVGGKGELVEGDWQLTNEGGTIIVPCIVNKITAEYVRLNILTLKNGSIEYTYTKNSPEPLCLDITNTDEVFTRLIKTDWNGFEC